MSGFQVTVSHAAITATSMPKSNLSAACADAQDRWMRILQDHPRALNTKAAPAEVRVVVNVGARQLAKAALPNGKRRSVITLDDGGRVPKSAATTIAILMYAVQQAAGTN